jgi:hypothetical protein
MFLILHVIMALFLNEKERLFLIQEMECSLTEEQAEVKT